MTLTGCVFIQASQLKGRGTAYVSLYSVTDLGILKNLYKRQSTINYVSSKNHVRSKFQPDHWLPVSLRTFSLLPEKGRLLLK